MSPALKELLVVLLAGALLILATSVRFIPASDSRVCGSDEECVRLCVRQGKDPERCSDVLGNDDEPLFVRI